MRAMVAERLGEPDVLTPADLPDPRPGPGQTLLEVEAAGLNFADAERLRGAYLPPQLPFVPGGEVVGRGPDGRRVLAFTSSGFATKALVKDPVEIPEDLPAGAALALLVQGLTAWHLVRTAARIVPGETVVVNAAAGGVGHLAIQLAREFGARRVIGAASTPDKRALVLRLGADAAIAGEADGYAERIREANGGALADVILDAVGGPVFAAAPHALAPFGRLITYGTSGGIDPAPLDPGVLSERNIAVGGYWLGAHLRLPGSRAAAPLHDLLALAASGHIQPLVGAEYPLDQAATALTALVTRRTTGKVILRVR
ncbi:zinc-binding dehydrogenase [Nonomuraea phyllanthi]|uniref:quinone oxidoreductase family protein n=1 Tax=Nonomuraea phyllanthi TaxID=2219224 RepID=UPI0012931B68|nr:zinc-binding dehydrogenase [Nonomuraea phyllanthi]QFY10372.1 zinc-binding dehydrogenase [Nonomuraea phyllanthi]